MLNNSGESGHPCLVPDLRGNAFSFSPLRIMFAVLYIIYGLYCVDIGSFYFHFLKSFNHKQVLYFVKGFFYIYWDYHMIFIFQLVTMVYHIDWFAFTEESLHPWYKPNLIMVYEFFSVLLNCICKNFVEDFCICLSVILTCSYIFVCCRRLVLVSGWWWPHGMSLEVLLPLQFFERVLER